MKYVHLENIDLDFPVLGVKNQSLKNALINTASKKRIHDKNNNMMYVKALKNINLYLKEGDRLGIMGHNGAGKTTLLRLIAGVYPPSNGKISINGNIGSLLSITFGMDYEASGFENILLRGLLLGFTKNEIEKIREEVIEFADLGEFIHMPLRVYSSGMVMRLAFALATSKRCDIILMDEWLSVGDIDFEKKANQRLEESLSNSKILIFSSHSKEMLNKHCNIIINLQNGEIKN